MSMENATSHYLPPVELFPFLGNKGRVVQAIEIPKDVQKGIRELYGERELLRRIAEVDQRDAKLRDDIAADVEEITRRQA